MSVCSEGLVPAVGTLRCGHDLNKAAIQTQELNDSFSNRASGSSSFHRFVSIFWVGSLIRVKLVYVAISGPVRLDRCMHVSDWSRSVQLSLALRDAQQPF